MVAEIPLRNQAFDLAFHPNNPLLFVALLTGQVTAFSYSRQSEEEFEYLEVFSVRPTRRSCRGLATSVSGDRVYSVTKDKTLHEIDTATGVVLDSVAGAHESAINRIALTMPNILATGDDEGVIKLWDPRNRPNREIRAYKQHFDYISDFLWLENKKHLVATSADGTLSVMDVRANKTQVAAQSEDQEDELLSLVAIQGGIKTVVGTQSGILSIFNNKTKGWGDSVDRIKGHPHSVDALCALPPALLPASLSDGQGQAILATGSSDGLVRLVQLFPTKILGVVADHGEFPVERLKMDFPGSEATGENGSRWLGSISHGETVVMTDLGDALEESDHDDNDVGMGESGGEDISPRGDEHDSDDEDEDEEQTPKFIFGSTNSVKPATPQAVKSVTKTSPLDSFSFSKPTATTSPSTASGLAAASTNTVPRVRPKADSGSDSESVTGPSADSSTLQSQPNTGHAQKNEGEKGGEGDGEIRKKKKRRKGKGGGTPAVDPSFFDGL